MKKLALFALMICGMSTVACGTTATTTTARSGLVTGSFEKARVAAKDFEPVQLVFAETVVGSADGAGMTYDALLKEAYRVGAHGIINVVIEDVRVCEKSGVNARCVPTRYGSALAVRYTNALTYQNIVSGSDEQIKQEQAEAVAKKGFFDGMFSN